MPLFLMGGDGMWIDNLIGFFNPKAAYEREVWRQQLDTVKNYDAANNGRLNSHRRVANESG